MACRHGEPADCAKCEYNAKQRESRRKDGDAATKRYEKTPSGFLMRSYRNMQSRVTGVQKKKAHLYFGLPLLEREAFYAWARDSPEFWRLYRRWVFADYDRKLTPTVNRIDPRRGYEEGNMEWVTHSVNSSLASHSHRVNASLVRLAERAAAA